MTWHSLGEYQRLKTLKMLHDEGPQSGDKLYRDLNEDLCQATYWRQIITRLKLHSLLAMSEPAFFHMMQEMEDAQQVEGWNEERCVNDVKTLQRWYRIRSSGIHLVEKDALQIRSSDFNVGWSAT